MGDPQLYVLSMLPSELWQEVFACISNPLIGRFIRLAQVNREFRNAFLSDEAWKRFDACGVRGQGHVYIYGAYKLAGVAAHFYNYLSSLPQPEQASFFNRFWYGGEYMTSGDLYSQINALSLFAAEITVDYSSLQLVGPGIWELWSSTHLVEPSRRDSPFNAGCIPSWALQNKQVCLFLIQIERLDFVPPVFENYWDVNLAVVANKLLSLDVLEIPPQFQRNKQFILTALSLCETHRYYDFDWDFDEMPFLVDFLRTDEELLFKTISVYGCALEFAPEDLQANREVVLVAVTKYGNALAFASKDLRADREVGLAAISRADSALEYASEDLRADREVVLAIVSRAGDALRYASKDLRADRELVLAAVSQHGDALKFASKNLRNSLEFVLAAIKVNVKALRCAPKALQCDPEIEAVALASAADLSSLPPILHQRAAFVWEALRRKEPRHLESCKDLLKDKYFAFWVVSQFGVALKYVPPVLQDDKEVVLAAVRVHKGALRFASERLKADPEVLAVVNR